MMAYFSNRMFVTEDGTRYEWRRLYPEDPTAYDVEFPSYVLVTFADILAAIFGAPYTHC